MPANRGARRGVTAGVRADGRARGEVKRAGGGRVGTIDGRDDGGKGVVMPDMNTNPTHLRAFEGFASYIIYVYVII